MDDPQVRRCARSSRAPRPPAQPPSARAVLAWAPTVELGLRHDGEQTPARACVLDDGDAGVIVLRGTAVPAQTMRALVRATAPDGGWAEAEVVAETLRPGTDPRFDYARRELTARWGSADDGHESDPLVWATVLRWRLRTGTRAQGRLSVR